MQEDQFDLTGPFCWLRHAPRGAMKSVQNFSPGDPFANLFTVDPDFPVSVSEQARSKNGKVESARVKFYDFWSRYVSRNQFSTFDRRSRRKLYFEGWTKSTELEIYFVCLVAISFLIHLNVILSSSLLVILLVLHACFSYFVIFTFNYCEWSLFVQLHYSIWNDCSSFVWNRMFCIHCI